MRDFDLPELAHFNSAPCERHRSLDEGMADLPPCRSCGVRLRKHQRVGVAWLYMRGRGLIADQVGTGKTAQAAGLIAAVKQAGELDTGGKVIVICRPSALQQWSRELHRFLPQVGQTTAEGAQLRRRARYDSAWDILVTGFQMFVKDSADGFLDHVTAHTMIIDDVDALRNRKNQTAYQIKRTAKACQRVVILNGTPLQKRLQELHSILEPLGGWDVFGSESYFKKRYVRDEFVSVYNTTIGRKVTTRKVTGYQNLDEFVRKAAPFTLRRTPAHIDDVDLPVILPHNIYLDLYPSQRERYDGLRRGVLKIMASQGTRVKMPDAMAQFLYGAQICSGLVSLGEPDRPRTSSKLDFVEALLVDGDLSDEKVVVFCQFTDTADALMRRLTRGGVGAVVIWGRESRKDVRQRAIDRFWDDPACRVLVGTTAIEQSLNLQVSRHLINVDQILNPARMQQLAGRIRRDGSAYKSVYVHNLLARSTQEEGYLQVLRREQALADHVFGESNQLFEALNPLALLELIGKS